MSCSNSENNYHSQFNSSDDDYDKDDLITFQYESQIFSLYNWQFFKYSLYFREKYINSNVKDYLPKDLHDLQENSDINSENIIYFFQLLQNNFEIDEKTSLTYKQYVDLVNISEHFKTKKLSKKLMKYFKDRKVDPNFIIEILQYQSIKQKDTENIKYKIEPELENVLTSRIHDCFLNENFPKLTFSIIYRIVELSFKKKQIKSDNLLDFINKSIEKFYMLFRFVDVFELSDDKLDQLLSIYSKYCESKEEYFYSFQIDLKQTIEMIRKNRNQKEQLNSFQINNDQIQKQLNDFIEINQKLQNEIDLVKFENDQIKQKCDLLQKELNCNEKEKNDFKAQLENLKIENDQIKQKCDLLQKELNCNEKEKNDFKAQLEKLVIENNQIKQKYDLLQKECVIEKFRINGTIAASVKSGYLIEGEIKLNANKGLLDKSRSKFIISASNAEKLDVREYEDGCPITSLNQSFSVTKSSKGTYYVRACVFNVNGEMNEIISDKLTTTGMCLTFEFEGETKEIVLNKGKYKLEVWGAEGGPSIGKGANSKRGVGGLGGYSGGILTLNETTKLFIRVGGKGISANTNNGSATNGGFPDGGGTKTGHFSEYTTVPGTGGGSTSIRITDDSIYSRVIVAGGGGGASGDFNNESHGGFGGGSSGGNSYCESKLSTQGSGTQTGSSPGPKGTGPEGVAGSFGQGATGLYKNGKDSGGGGGGGWYGGGSGGHGDDHICSSGGGGSGWIFTRESYEKWKSGDPSNAHKFHLDSKFYLTDAITLDGSQTFPSPQGNCEEKGHHGNGFARITSE